MITQITTCLHVVTGFFSSKLVIADTHALGYNIKKIKLFRTTIKTHRYGEIQLETETVTGYVDHIIYRNAENGIRYLFL